MELDFKLFSPPNDLITIVRRYQFLCKSIYIHYDTTRMGGEQRRSSEQAKKSPRRVNLESAHEGDWRPPRKAPQTTGECGRGEAHRDESSVLPPPDFVCAPVVRMRHKRRMVQICWNRKYTPLLHHRLCWQYEIVGEGERGLSSTLFNSRPKPEIDGGAPVRRRRY